MIVYTDREKQKIEKKEICNMNDLLLVIDMQNVYLPDQPWACETAARTKENILKLLENHPKDQTIFTRYIAAEHPVGTWKTYNELNRKINENPWMNELMEGIKEAAESYPVYDKSTYSSFQVPAIRKAAQKADRVILTGVVSECCVLSTFFEGIDLGCKLIWLTNATSGLNPVLEEETLHILQGLSPLHVEFLSTEDYLSNR